jgi:hypothetical protein
MPNDSQKCEDCLCEEPLTLAEHFSIMRERAAELEHEQWAHWTDYMLQTLLNAHPELGKDENVIRWSRQILTQYKDLSEKEKESDRKWADRGIDIYASFAEEI